MNRPELRQQLRADRKLVAGGLDLNLIYHKKDPTQLIALMRVLRECVNEAVDAGSVDPLMSFLYANLEATKARFLGPQIACKKGCSFCCRVWVSVTAPEAFYVVKAVGGASKLTESIRAANAVTLAQSYQERQGMKTQCPVLVDHLCAVYPSRPLLCRVFHSLDAAACERAYTLLSGEEIPTPGEDRLLRLCYMCALVSALKNAGLARTFYEYNSALTLALDHADAEKRWLAGEDVLAGLREDPGGDMLKTEEYRMLYTMAFGASP